MVFEQNFFAGKLPKILSILTGMIILTVYKVIKWNNHLWQKLAGNDAQTFDEKVWASCQFQQRAKHQQLK